MGVGKQALFAFVALAIVLLMGEGAVRAYHFVQNARAGNPDEPRGYARDDPQLGYALKEGFQEGNLRINSLGFRGPEFAPDKPADTYRIVNLGDSVTFGPHEEECSYPYLLPALLGPKQVESINAGVEGYRSDRALIRLQRDVLPLRPDLVTVFIGWNDLYQTDPRQESEALSIRGNPFAQLLAMSDAAQTFRRLYFLRFNTRRAQTSAVDDPTLLASYTPEGYAARLREIFRTARAGGADVIALTWPTILSDDMSPEAIAKAHYPWYTRQLGELKTLYARYQATVRQVAQQEGVPVVDAASAFDGRDKAPLFKDTVHFTCEGHQLVAEQLAAQIRSGAAPSFNR